MTDQPKDPTQAEHDDPALADEPALGDESPPSRTIHDARFKDSFSDPKHAADVLRTALPTRIAKRIDWTALELEQANLAGRSYRQHYGDLLFRARLRDTRPVYLWLVFEHQSTVDHWMPLRIAEFVVALWKRWHQHHPEAERLPAVLPVVFYQGAHEDSGPWDAPTSMSELLDLPDDARVDLQDYLLECRFVLDDLAAVDDDTLAARDTNPFAKLSLIVFKYGRSPDLLSHFSRYQEEIRALLTMAEGDTLWFELTRYTWYVNPYVEQDQLISHLRPIVGEEAANTMMTLAEKIEQRGLQRGLEQGLEQGLAKERALLLRFLERRFGAVPADVAARVATSQWQQVEGWLERTLDAASLEEVFAAS